MPKTISLLLLGLYIVTTGIPTGTGVEATHLFAPPLYLLSFDPLNPNGITVNDESTEEVLKIFVSPDDSSIRIKKDSDYNVTYNLEWKNETVKEDCSVLRIFFGMMDNDDKSWTPVPCLIIPDLDLNNYSYKHDCQKDSFQLTYHGQDHGKTEIVISKVQKFTKASSSSTSSSTSTSTAASTAQSTTSSSTSSSSSEKIVEVENYPDNPEDITKNVESTKANVKVAVYLSDGINTFNDVIGWIYFAAWSVSFYPQVYINWKRKSVVGLNFDFLSLNVVGFSLYSCYNCGLYFNEVIQSMYFDENDTQNVPVKVNDVVFGLHAVFACIVTIIQCFIYERAGQRVSYPCIGALIGIALFIISTSISAGVDAITWLDFLTWASYVKLGITIVKYMPQAYMNFRRKSTQGWSIGNVLLDFTGGSLSMLQMIMDSYNLDDWSSFFGDFTKFGLGMFSVLFDILFIMQHYVCYRNAADHDSNEETNQLSNQEEGDSRANGHENLAYVADEVAGVASSSLEDKKD